MSPEQENLVIENLPIVRRVALHIHDRLPRHVEICELTSAGVLGLIDAANKFDPKKSAKFSTYARIRIRGAILDSLRILDWSPRELRRKARTTEEAIRSVTARTGRSPSEPEIASEMGMALSEYQQLLGELRGLDIGRLDIQVSEDSEEELVSLLAGEENDPLVCCLRSEMQSRLACMLDQLPERERMMMTLYYYEELTMKEIGLTLGVVESRVSQMHASAVLRLRSLVSGGNLGKSAVSSRRRKRTRTLESADLLQPLASTTW